MKIKIRLIGLALTPLMLVTVVILSTGCQCCKKTSAAPPPATATAAPAPASAPAVIATPVAPAVATALPPVHIKAGASAPFTDPAGVVWLAGVGFADGDTIDREDAQIANTTNPGIYRSERYSMTSFSYPVPNGKYTVKLHFCETYEGVTGAGERVFSFNVEGHEFKDFDVFVKAGGAGRAYVETVPVEVTDGKLDITFTSNVENPEINGVEIIPAS
ncbi:MAG: malectin [Verrucomicrobiota bacterium]